MRIQYMIAQGNDYTRCAVHMHSRVLWQRMKLLGALTVLGNTRKPCDVCGDSFEYGMRTSYRIDGHIVVRCDDHIPFQERWDYMIETGRLRVIG